VLVAAAGVEVEVPVLEVPVLEVPVLEVPVLEVPVLEVPVLGPLPLCTGFCHRKSRLTLAHYTSTKKVLHLQASGCIQNFCI